MKIKLFTKKLTFINVNIDGQIKDYPKDLPIPREGEYITMGDIKMVKVILVSYSIINKKLRIITIVTEPSDTIR